MFDTQSFQFRCEGCSTEQVVQGYDAAEKLYEKHTAHSNRIVIEKHEASDG